MEVLSERLEWRRSQVTRGLGTERSGVRMLSVTEVSVDMPVLPTVLLESVVSVLLWSVFVVRVLVGMLVLPTVLLVSVVLMLLY